MEFFTYSVNKFRCIVLYISGVGEIMFITLHMKLDVSK
jgi:hypothetical protein